MIASCAGWMPQKASLRMQGAVARLLESVTQSGTKIWRSHRSFLISLEARRFQLVRAIERHLKSEYWCPLYVAALVLTQSFRGYLHSQSVGSHHGTTLAICAGVFKGVWRNFPSDFPQAHVS